MSKHTEGPWKLEAGRNFVTKSGEFYLSYDRDKHGNALFRDFCELDCNAHLIAAAPEMLAALKEVLADRAKLELHYETLAIIDDAIAKAEGRQL